MEELIAFLSGFERYVLLFSLSIERLRGAELETTSSEGESLMAWLPFCSNFLLFFYLAHFLFLTFILNKKLQFISVTYLSSHGVEEKAQSGLEPADPTATPMVFHATPG